MIKKISWSIMAVLAVGVGGYALIITVIPDLRPTYVSEVLFQTPVVAAGHFVGGAVALLVGAFQVNSRLRSLFLSTHRWLGRVYVISVIIGAIFGFILALGSQGGLITHVGFGMLAICWSISTLFAFYFILGGNINSHQNWMMRSYALTLAAVTLRIYLPVSEAAGISFEAAYPTISWFCWVPNILIVEWFLLSRQTPEPVAVV